MIKNKCILDKLKMDIYPETSDKLFYWLLAAWIFIAIIEGALLWIL